MPYEPTFPHPYLEAIDVSLDTGNNFQCVINPRDRVTSYKLTIAQAEDGKELYHVIGEISADNTFNKYYQVGTEIRTKIDDIPAQDTPLPLQGKINSDESTLVINVPKHLAIANGKEYMWKIELGDSSGSTSTSKDYYFTTAKTPEVSFDIPEVVNSSRLDIVANYTQEQGITPASFIFNLYMGAQIVYTTDDVFSADISFSYDKLITNRSYTLELIVTLDNGMEITHEASFDVSYSEISNLVSPTAKTDNSNAYIEIDFSDNATIAGNIDGDETGISYIKAYNSGDDVPKKDNVLSLGKDTSVYWNKSNNNPLQLETASHLLHLRLHKPFSGKFFEKIDEESPLRNISVYFHEGQFFYNMGVNDSKYHNVYEKIVSAVAGSDGYSVSGTLSGYSKTDSTIQLENSGFIKEGMRVQIGNEYRTIKELDQTGLATLDSAFDAEIASDAKYVVYSKDYMYVLDENTEIALEDILVDYDMTPDSWWYIYISPNGVEFTEDTNNIIIEGVG